MNQSKQVVLNLTTTNGRLELCSATLWSLVNQTLLPREINVWISRNAYLSDEGIDHMPDSILKIMSICPFVHIKYVENTGPYRKIIPALRCFADDDILVYADDDVIYSKQWLKLLVECYLSCNCEYVVSSRVRKMTKNFLGKYQSYNRFPILYNEIICERDFIITGIGGCVLQKKHINPEYIYIEDYKLIAPKTDDLWISKLIEMSGSKVFTCPQALSCIMEINHEIHALNQTNTIRPRGHVIRRVCQLTKMKVLGYLGFKLSNNDHMIEKIRLYFNKGK